jgi:hypothetical protein
MLEKARSPLGAGVLVNASTLPVDTNVWFDDVKKSAIGRVSGEDEFLRHSCMMPWASGRPSACLPPPGAYARAHPSKRARVAQTTGLVV